MANPVSFISDMLHNLSKAMGALSGLAKATHEEAQGARVAAERGSGGRGFDVLEGLPTGSGNARSLTAMLSGMRRSTPAMPRTGSPQSVIPITEEALQSGGSGAQSLPHMLGRMVGGIFRKLTGGSGASSAASGAVAGAGQTGMTGGLLVRSVGGAMLGGAGSALGVGTAIYGVSKALDTFAQHINEQSRHLRSYSAGTNVAFAALGRQQDIIKHQMAGGTAGTLNQATQAQAGAAKSWQPFDTWWTNTKNKMSTIGSTIWGGVGSAFSAMTQSSGFEKAVESARERAKSPAQKERERYANLTTSGQIIEQMMGFGPGKRAGNLNLNGGIPNFGNLAGQIGMGAGMGGGAAGGGAAFDAMKLGAAKGFALGIPMPPPQPDKEERKKTSAEAHAEDMEERRKRFMREHPGRAAADAAAELRKRRDREEINAVARADKAKDDAGEGRDVLRKENLEASRRRRAARKVELDRAIAEAKNRVHLLKPGERQ